MDIENLSDFECYKMLDAIMRKLGEDNLTTAILTISDAVETPITISENGVHLFVSYVGVML